MYRERLRRMLGHFKRALRRDQRLGDAEFDQRLQPSEAIIDYGRMTQADHGYSVPDVILEITELASRFRETTQTIQDSLRLLRDIGRAEPADLDGCWKLQLPGTLPSCREDFYSATHHSYIGRKTSEIHFGQKDLQQH